MNQDERKKTWTTPVIEKVALEFDKDMVNSCIVASATSPDDAGCKAVSGCYLFNPPA